MDITLIVALIAAIAAIVSPVITEIISQFSARRLKKIELLFTSQVDAYKNFISVASLFPFSPDYRDMNKLSDAQNQAFLYSSLETRKKLSDYVAMLSDEANVPPGALGKAQHEAILAMQRELCQAFRFTPFAACKSAEGCDIIQLRTFCWLHWFACPVRWSQHLMGHPFCLPLSGLCDMIWVEKGVVMIG